jgi:hypothetical protein
MQDAIEEEGIVSPFLEPDGLVQELRGSGIPDLVALDGYLDEPTGETQRLFKDLARSFWVDIGEDDLVTKRRVSVPGFPDASVVWVRRGAQLTVGASFPEEEDLPESITPEDLLTQGDPPLWADVTRVQVVER